MVVGIAMLAGHAVVATPASAVSFAKGVYQPHKLGACDQVTAWADVQLNYDGTFGSWVFVKIESWNADPAVPVWYKSWRYLGGYWAKDGWNQVTVPLQPGVNNYRLVADSYNDVLQGGNIDVGLSKGAVSGTVNLGDGVKRYHTSSTATSAALRCVA